VSAVAPRAPSILFVGDVVGGLGRRTLLALLPRLRAEHEPTFVVVNGENAAGGLGITPKIADELFAAGVDVITLGNHTYQRREIFRYLDEHDAILRPANYLAAQPGHGSCVVARDGVRLGVVNLSGNVFLQAGRPAFTEIEAVLGRLEDKVDHVLVDMHAEATSEKVAMGWYLDGRVSAVVGTHTHVPTADHQILPGGTAFQTDAGMCGDYDSVIGMQKGGAALRFWRKMPGERLAPAEGEATLCGLFVETEDSTGLARRVAALRMGGGLEAALPA
jgi:metallophosphoesterase (TIGR00282 family)